MCLSSLDFFFFFKQKTAYEITYGDWSSDVCSSDLPRFGFQSVPEQKAPHGETLEFFVGGETAAVSLQATVEPQPAGSITFDAATGRVSYAPAAADRLPFSVTFTASSGESGTC